ncbi:hypothetical protein PENSPDRAFT_594804, partial [Peniophora sp. CONT]
VYFNILLRALSISGKPTTDCLRFLAAFNAYTMQLCLWSSDYEFSALLEYHQAFFDSRLTDMLRGEYLS